MSSAPPSALWNITKGRPYIDANELMRAIEAEIDHEPLDFRTRLLIRDSINGLIERWGEARVRQWLDSSPRGQRIERLWRDEDLGDPGFPHLASRLMDPITPDHVITFLRELSRHVRRPTRLVVGGSTVLILHQLLSQNSDYIDVVDEVPEELRSQHAVLDDLAQRYGIRIAHFQSHYLPEGWQNRVRPLERLGNLDVALVDPYDVAITKVFSRRSKDRDDLRVMVGSFDRTILERRMRDTTSKLRADERMAEAGRENWFILFGEPLPQAPSSFAEYRSG